VGDHSPLRLARIRAWVEDHVEREAADIARWYIGAIEVYGPTLDRAIVRLRAGDYEDGSALGMKIAGRWRREMTADQRARVAAIVLPIVRDHLTEIAVARDKQTVESAETAAKYGVTACGGRTLGAARLRLAQGQTARSSYRRGGVK
jgi:hypothetical protein